MATVNIARGTDPFKKYWWVVLLAFGGIGLWICRPLMDTSVGSGSVSAQEGSLKGPQSLDSVHNPAGAPGGSVDLSMDGTYRKKKDGPITSSLYQAPEEPKTEPAVAASAPAPARTMADALRDVSRKTAAAADPSGWGGQKAQKGFEAPKANFGSMSGFSGSSGSGASMSSSGGSFSGGSVTGFGATKAETSFASTRGLRDDGSAASGKGGTRAALENAQSASIAAAGQRSADSARAMAGATFDGGARGGGIGGGGSATAGGGAYGSLDSAPVNLKSNDPKLNQMKFEPPPTPDKKEQEDPNDKMRQQMTQMVMMMLIAGVMGGI